MVIIWNVVSIIQEGWLSQGALIALINYLLNFGRGLIKLKRISIHSTSHIYHPAVEKSSLNNLRIYWQKLREKKGRGLLNRTTAG